MKTKDILITGLCLFSIVFSSKIVAQDSLYNLSFKANQFRGNFFNTKANAQDTVSYLPLKKYRHRYEDSYCQHYYKLQKEENRYRLVDHKDRDIFKRNFDTIMKNPYFIKTVSKDTISIYRIMTLEKVEIPNLKQAYLFRDGLEVLTNEGAQYYDNTISKVDNFNHEDYFRCGTVYSKEYRLEHDPKTNIHKLFLSFGDFGSFREKTTLTLSVSKDIEKITFLGNAMYASKSVNNFYNPYPELLIVTRNGKNGIYGYNLDEAIYSRKKKVTGKMVYRTDKTTGDTICKYRLPPPIESPFSPKNGTIKLHEVLPIVYNKVERNSDSGLIYLHKDDMIGIFPGHANSTFQAFDEKTKSFYSIKKNDKQGWVDIKTFKEYYF